MLVACAMPNHRAVRNTDENGLSRIAPSPVWRVPTQLEFTLKHRVDVSAWRCSFYSDGITHMQSLAPDVAQSELILVGGYALAIRGAMPLRQDMLEIVDDIMLNQQLATLLLQQALPQGPESVTLNQRVHMDESNDPVATETTNTSRYYYPPWKLDGEVRRVSVDSIAFDLQFDAHTPEASAPREKYYLSGLWQQRTPVAKLADNFPLTGWSIFRIRMGTRDAGGVSVASYVTTPESRRYQTLGELRANVPTAR